MTKRKDRPAEDQADRPVFFKLRHCHPTPGTPVTHEVGGPVDSL